MSKFFEGQMVKIKTDLIVEKTYGGRTFVKPMSKYRGKYAKIVLVDSDGDYKIDIDDIWWWSDGMLEPVSCCDCVHHSKGVSEEPCCSCIARHRFKPRNTFEVGELVRIKDDMVIGKKYGNLTYISNMDDYKGRVYRVSKISKEGNYTLSSTNPFYWSGDMLEPTLDCEYINCEDINEDRLEVNAPTVAELEKTIMETCKLIIDNTDEDDFTLNDLHFMHKLTDSCCKHKLYRTMVEGGREDGNSKD